MPRCPVCEAARVIIVVGETRRGLCSTCGARWVQDGDVQRRIERPSRLATVPGGNQEP